MNDLKFDPLGDGVSLVEYVDHMGSDFRVAATTRKSYDSKAETFTNEENDNLVRSLTKEYPPHTGPFEHVSVTLMVNCPIFVARQWQRHRTFSYSEISRRYTKKNIEVYLPRPESMRQSVKRGAENAPLDYPQNEESAELVKNATFTALASYDRLVSQGVAKEQSRMILPQNLYTFMYATGNLKNWAHFYTLRADHHAQQEIRVYAEAIGEIMDSLFPVAWKALTGGRA